MNIYSNCIYRYTQSWHLEFILLTLIYIVYYKKTSSVCIYMYISSINKLCIFIYGFVIIPIHHINFTYFFFLNRCTFKMAPTRVIYFNRPMLENIDGRWGWGVISLCSYLITVVLKWFNIFNISEKPIVVVNATKKPLILMLKVHIHVFTWTCGTVLQRIICLEC